MTRTPAARSSQASVSVENCTTQGASCEHDESETSSDSDDGEDVVEGDGSGEAGTEGEVVGDSGVGAGSSCGAEEEPADGDDEADEGGSSVSAHEAEAGTTNTKKAQKIPHASRPTTRTCDAP